MQKKSRCHEGNVCLPSGNGGRIPKAKYFIVESQGGGKLCKNLQFIAERQHIFARGQT